MCCLQFPLFGQLKKKSPKDLTYILMYNTNNLFQQNDLSFELSYFVLIFFRTSICTVEQRLCKILNLLLWNWVEYFNSLHIWLKNKKKWLKGIEYCIINLTILFIFKVHLLTLFCLNFFIDRIDSNVQDAELSIEAAHTQILRYFQSVSSNRWLMIKIFGILIFFFIFFVIFLS